MSKLGAIREGLANNLSLITGLQCDPYALASPTPPGLQVIPGEIQYDQAMGRGLDIYNLTVQAFYAFTADIDNQQALDELLDPNGAMSVKDAIESDPTLGGEVDDLHVTDCSGYQIRTRPDNTALLTAEWRVTVYVRGN